MHKTCSFLLASLFMGSLCLADTDHGGADWTLTSGEFISGVHTNVGAFTVPAGVTVYLDAWNGSTGGRLEVYADTVDVAGTIRADGRGYRGGNGGRGGNGIWRAGLNTPASTAGNSGEGSYGGTGGASKAGRNYGTADPDWQLHRYWHGENGNSGYRGGYMGSLYNGDTTTNEIIVMGSGGGGGSGGTGGGGYGRNFDQSSGAGGGGGAGNPGGGAVLLRATGLCRVGGYINASGYASSRGNGSVGGSASSRWSGSNGGAGGNRDSGGSSSGASGGHGSDAADNPDTSTSGGSGGSGAQGAGGGVLLKGAAVDVTGGSVNTLGGGSETGNGGTLKIFYVTSYAAGSYATGRTFVDEFTPTALDIGVRIHDGSETVSAAVEPAGILTSPLRIAKDGVVYGIELVETNDLNASGIYIQTSAGTKAVRKL